MVRQRNRTAWCRRRASTVTAISVCWRQTRRCALRSPAWPCRRRRAAAAPPAHPSATADEPVHRRAARYAWALLFARIDEISRWRRDAHHRLRRRRAHHSRHPRPPRRADRAAAIAPACGPPLWDLPHAEAGGGGPSLFADFVESSRATLLSTAPCGVGFTILNKSSRTSRRRSIEPLIARGSGWQGRATHRQEGRGG